MDTKALRQKILDLAIRGKLVPQDPNDEPASVLLERIREQKKQMVKEGKLKAKDIKNDSVIFVGEDNLHYEKFADGTVKCIEDEIPFEVPEGWKWTRLGVIFSHNTGKALNKSKAEGTMLTYITTSNLYWNRFEIDKLKSMPFTDTEVEKCTVRKGDLLVCEGGDIGRSAIWNYDDEIRIQNHIHRLRSYIELNIEFYYHVFYLYKLTDMINGKGIGIQGLSSNQLHSVLMPLPPIQEQHRIVTKLNELISFIEVIESDKADLQTTIQLTKSKILDLAIRGKLASQDPNDEPASILLERIRAEKEELIKQGKIKRDKKESIIFKGVDNSYYEKIGNEVHCIDDEIPFELPNGWNWVRLKMICSKIIDGSHNPPKGSDEKTPYIMASSRNICFDTVTDLENIRYLNDKDFEKEDARSQLTINDILLTTVATLGRSCIYDGFPENLCFQRSVTVITTNILPQYLKIFFDAPYFQDFILNNATGTAQKGFYLNQLEGVLVCVPPADEQKRLSDKIQQLLSSIQQIEKSLT